jgi:hypothetical protein
MLNFVTNPQDLLERIRRARSGSADQLQQGLNAAAAGGVQQLGQLTQGLRQEKADARDEAKNKLVMSGEELRQRLDQERNAREAAAAPVELDAKRQAVANAAAAEKRAAEMQPLEVQGKQAQITGAQNEQRNEAEDRARKKLGPLVAAGIASGLDPGEIAARVSKIEGLEGVGADEILAEHQRQSREMLEHNDALEQARRKLDSDLETAKANRANLYSEAQARKEAAAAKGAAGDDKTLQRKRIEVTNEVESFRKNLKDNIQALKDQITKTGTFEAFGPESADMERRLNAVATDMAKLADPGSVARPSEVEEARKGLIPTGPKALTMGNDTALQILSHLNSEIDKRADNAYAVRGMPLPGAAATKAEHTDGKVVVTNGKETFRIPRESLLEAQADGFREVR